MSLLITALNQIIGYLEQLKPEYAEALQPGLSYNEIDEHLIGLPFRLPAEVYTIYQWRNGMYQEDYFDGDSLFSPYFTIDPLEQAVLRYRERVEIARLRWNPLWFPLLYCSPKSCFFVIGLIEKQDASPVFYKDVEFENPSLRYDSLTEMMIRTAEQYHRGIYFVDEFGDLTTDE